MKKLYVVLVSLLVVSCSSVPKSYLETNNLCKYDAPIFTITKNDLTFNLEKYKDKLKEGNLVLVDNDSVKKEYRLLDNWYVTTKETNKKISISKYIDYYKNGTVESIYFKYKNGYLDIYKKFLYDKKGNVEKVISHDKGYKICWAEAIAIVKKIAKHKIKKYEITSFYLYKVDLDEFPQAKPMWFVGLSDGNEKLLKEKFKNGSIRYVIDGVTGKFIGINRVIMKYD